MKDYFAFNTSEKMYLNSINEEYDRELSPYAAKNMEAIRLYGKPRYDIIRPDYSYDVDCIIHNPLYNRYADKTQVFSFYRNDDLTRRALHVQFVSKIAKTIGRALKLNLDLIEAISLGHDMGHTPFGHKGEEFLSECYQNGCMKRNGQKRYFNHNVHSARIFRYILNSNLTMQTLSGIISHNGEKVCKEYTPSVLTDFDTFDELLEKCYIENDYHKRLRPSTLEGCVVRISDMIAYAGKDRQDLYRAKLITDKQFKKERLIGTNNRDIISNIVINIIKNSIESPSINMDREVFDDLKDLIAENYDIIYGNAELNEPYYEVIKPLMEKLYDRLVEDVEKRNFKSPVFQHYLNDTIQGKCYREKPRGRIIASPDDIVTDFIASMTDDYFVDICKYLHIDDGRIEKLKYHKYFDIT
ncbi:MAG: HD domain-containing protein [Lachnospira sp.]|nr:HD domain-containing protein [Lachnospira sp.]